MLQLSVAAPVVATGWCVSFNATRTWLGHKLCYLSMTDRAASHCTSCPDFARIFRISHVDLQQQQMVKFFAVFRTCNFSHLCVCIGKLLSTVYCLLSAVCWLLSADCSAPDAAVVALLQMMSNCDSLSLSLSRSLLFAVLDKHETNPQHDDKKIEFLQLSNWIFLPPCRSFTPSHLLCCSSPSKAYNQSFKFLVLLPRPLPHSCHCTNLFQQMSKATWQRRTSKVEPVLITHSGRNRNEIKFFDHWNITKF